jgi:hypothetical protein
MPFRERKSDTKEIKEICSHCRYCWKLKNPDRENESHRKYIYRCLKKHRRVGHNNSCEDWEETGYYAVQVYL